MACQVLTLNIIVAPKRTCRALGQTNAFRREQTTPVCVTHAPLSSQIDLMHNSPRSLPHSNSIMEQLYKAANTFHLLHNSGHSLDR